MWIVEWVGGSNFSDIMRILMDWCGCWNCDEYFRWGWFFGYGDKESLCRVWFFGEFWGFRIIVSW